MSQPPPVPSNRPRIADRVIEDIAERMKRGVQEYGTALQAHNGRRALQDLYEELLDGAHYIRQRMDEEDRALRQVLGDESVRTTLTEIYDRVQTIRKKPGVVNRRSLEQRYIDDVSYLRHVTEALLLELWLRDQTPTAPPEGTEVALYQYGCAGNGESVDFGDDYDQEWVDRWVSDPKSLVAGYYPVYRPLYGGQWYRVDPERPPVQPEDSRWGAEPPAAPEDAGGA